jgi:PIN domain nuclease of toxin-antitoxin system
MKYLLDTHVILWWFDDPEKLSREAREVISLGDRDVYVSSVSVWEIVIKRSLGKLHVPEKIFDLIEEKFYELPVTSKHARSLDKIPHSHSDPFDRLLIAQAISENFMLITRDKNLNKYDIPIIRA